MKHSFGTAKQHFRNYIIARQYKNKQKDLPYFLNCQEKYFEKIANPQYNRVDTNESYGG